MERLTETNLEKIMRIGFDLIDRHIDYGIKKLDAMKVEYEKKLKPKGSIMAEDIYAIISRMQGQAQLQGLIMGERNYAALQKMPMSFDLGQNDMSVAARFAMMGGVGVAPVYRSSFIGSGIA